MMPRRRLLALLPWLTFPALAQVAAPPVAAPASTSVEGPSFDCAKARGRTEKAICSDRGLAILDRRVTELFAVALSQTIDAGDVKRAQRRWLGERDDCRDISCIAQSYERRIDELGKLTGRLRPNHVSALCERIVDPEARGKLLAATSGADDINNDGVADRAARCAGGTANIPCVEYADADGKPLAIRPDGFEWMTYSPFGRASFHAEGHTFTYYSHDDALDQPAFISYVTPTNREVRVCDFATSVGSAVLEGGDEVCAAVESADESIETLELTPVGTPDAYALGRRDTQSRSLAKIDIDNDGLDEDLVEFQYSSGAGRGCEINYFELLADDGRSIASNSNATAVRMLQGFGANGIDARNCGLVSNRLFRFGEKIYFESNASNAIGTPHELRILQGTATSSVCTFERQVRTRVKTLY